MPGTRGGARYTIPEHYDVLTLARNIRNRRLLLGMPQYDLAALADLSKRTISLIETGKIQHPQATTVWQIAHALHTSPQALWTPTNTNSPVYPRGTSGTIPPGAKTVRE